MATLFNNQAAWLPTERARAVQVGPGPKPNPGELEVVIRVAYAAVNPTDWKMQDEPYFKFEYPFIFGTDVAGTIVQLGSSVTRFKVGQRVIGHCDSLLTHKATNSGFQLYSTCREILVAGIPDSLPLSSAAVLPLSISTAAAGLYGILSLPYPSLDPKPTGETILIWGGSSSCGSSAIQLAVASGFTVATTAGKANHDYVKNLGASIVFDHKDAGVVQNIIKLFSEECNVGSKAGDVYVLDSIGDKETQAACAEIVSALGGGKLPINLWPIGPFPNNVDATLVNGLDPGMVNLDIGDAVWRKYIPEALLNGKFQAKPDPCIIEGGLGKVQEGIDLLRKGVSAKKKPETLSYLLSDSSFVKRSNKGVASYSLRLRKQRPHLSVIVATVGQPTFYSSLNLEVIPTAPSYSHTTTIIGAVNGVFFAGGFCGTFVGGWMGDRFGRVRSLRCAAGVGFVGAVIQTAAIDQGMYLLARIITGVATGHIAAAMPTYYSEVAPPHSRGLMTGAHGSFINMGYAVAGWVGFGCYHASGSTFGWRFPNAVLILWSLCLLGGTFFVPESPRWLIGQDHDDQALAILCRLHHDTNDPEDHFARQEIAIIKNQHDSDRNANAADGRWQLFTKKTYRNRMILATMVMVGGQNSGVLVINNYNTLLYQSLGLTTGQALIVGASYNTWAMIANFGGAFLSDRLGRRNILVIGYTVNVSMFAIATALIAKYNMTLSNAYAASAVVFLFLYVTAYGACIDVNQFTIVSEVFPSHLRSQGSSLAIGSLFLADTLWLELASTATDTIGWKYYLVFISLSFLHTIYLYFRLPEMTGLPLEEVDALFEKAAGNNITSNDIEKVDEAQTEHFKGRC
ncbi:hypothetical protein B7494_g4450 [Chlorociboria aeruginascens]|nr:hypothetical protein B7494_g4450 [Chlorociboria aeruginascens]